MDLFVYLAFADFAFANWLTKECFLVLKRPVGNKNMHQSTSIDFIIRIKNGYKAGRKTISAPVSNFCIAMATLLKKTGYIADFSITGDTKKDMIITLAYDNNEPRVSDVRLFSKPGRRIYEKKSSLPWGKSPASLIIVSTSSGVMSQKEAKFKGLGGEIIAEIW
jgi:small subunit ribosomal protein S8